MPRLAEKYGYRENYNNTVYMPRRTYINAAGAKVREAQPRYVKQKSKKLRKISFFIELYQFCF